MPSILFVHGTGVREPSYDFTCATLTSRMAEATPGYQLFRCYWGGSEGSRLHANGASIPDYDTARAVGAVDDADIAIARWRLLYEDPDFELDSYIGQPSATRNFNPASDAPVEDITTLLNTETDRIRELKRCLRVDDVWIAAKSQLVAFIQTVLTAKRVMPGLHSEFRAAIARSLVAHAILLAFANSATQPDWPTGIDRDALVDALQEAWGADMGLLGTATGWIGNRLLRIALRLGTGKIARERGAISDAASPATGDVIMYQARGGGIRDFIQRILHEVPKPVVILAHSLGGIACVDLLAKERIAGVTNLITVGSQAPLLYELNALWSLPFGTPLPADFPDWLNIYDKHDFLSYIGNNVFPNRVDDVQVDNGQPFPQAHSAYWTNPAVWQVIARTLP